MGDPMEIQSTEKELIAAQCKARTLFEEVVESGIMVPGILESELSAEIHALARNRFGLSRHWHQRLVRSGPNTVMGYYDKVQDRRLEPQDTVYLDFGPIFDGWEADYGRTYVLGDDPIKHRLVADIEAAFVKGKEYFRSSPKLTAGEMYDYVCDLAKQSGWEYGGESAGHLIGRFPHETIPGDLMGLEIHRGNALDLRARDAGGGIRHWILEIHFVDRVRQFGGFHEELLTI
jgi:methionine aminopeptidase